MVAILANPPLADSCHNIAMAEPLFSSAHAALVFAFNVSSQNQDRPLMGRLAAPAQGNGKGLSGLDGAAQAGMIRAEVKALGRLPEAMLIARIAPRWYPCTCLSSCCSGKKLNAESSAAIGYLADHLRTTALAACATDSVMRSAYVMQYLAKDTDRINALADKFNLNRHTVSAHWRRTKKLLATLDVSAMNAIEDRLNQLGIICINE